MAPQEWQQNELQKASQQTGYQPQPYQDETTTGRYEINILQPNGQPQAGQKIVVDLLKGNVPGSQATYADQLNILQKYGSPQNLASVPLFDSGTVSLPTTA